MAVCVFHPVKCYSRCHDGASVFEPLELRLWFARHHGLKESVVALEELLVSNHLHEHRGLNAPVRIPEAKGKESVNTLLCIQQTIYGISQCR